MTDPRVMPALKASGMFTSGVGDRRVYGIAPAGSIPPPIRGASAKPEPETEVFNLRYNCSAMAIINLSAFGHVIEVSLPACPQYISG